MIDNERSKFFLTITSGILIVVLSGLVLFFFAFFNETFPAILTRVNVLENKFHHNNKKIDKIDNKIDKIYQILIERKR